MNSFEKSKLLTYLLALCAVINLVFMLLPIEAVDPKWVHLLVSLYAAAGSWICFRMSKSFSGDLDEMNRKFRNFFVAYVLSPVAIGYLVILFAR